MRLHVAFHPSLLATGALWESLPTGGAPAPVPVDRPQVCVVVDVLRASTSLVTLVERGAAPIYIASSVEAAQQAGRGGGALAGGLNDALMAGELEGLAPPGFDFGNSPVEFAAAEVRGRPVVFVTTNGTGAIRAVAHLGPVLIGAMRNGTAAAAETWERARSGAFDVTIMCAGREGGFGIDDAYCAGYLATRLLEHGSFDLTDGAAAALQLYRIEPDTLALFSRAASGQNVIRLGLGADVVYCAERDRSSAVPRLGREISILPER